MTEEDEAFNEIEKRSVDKAVNALSQRTWVGLTDEEVKECFKVTPDMHLPWHIYTRIEAKLKEKNT